MISFLILDHLLIQGDGAMCQSKVTHGLVQPFNRLYNGSWVFAALSSQV